VAVDKPAGLPVIAAEGSRSKSLYDIVTAYIRIKHPKGRAAVVHRLDRESSGALVFAKSSRAKTAVMSHWNELAKERVYHALVEGEIAEDKGRLDSWLVEAGPSRMRVAEPGERLALHAITEYRVIGRGGGYSLLSLSLETGRKHQIRVQLAAMGHPIAGDEKYGSRKDPVGRLCLHAVLLVLEHPFTGQLLRIECAPPPEFAAALARKPRPARPEKPRRDPGDSFVGPFGSPLGSAEGKADSLERKRPKARASAPDASPSASPRAGKNAVPPRRPSHRDAKPSKKR
jgi:23S rRNA pseudouridine1911/1915/1917 synthase